MSMKVIKKTRRYQGFGGGDLGGGGWRFFLLLERHRLGCLYLYYIFGCFFLVLVHGPFEAYPSRRKKKKELKQQQKKRSPSPDDRRKIVRHVGARGSGPLEVACFFGGGVGEKSVGGGYGVVQILFRFCCLFVCLFVCWCLFFFVLAVVFLVLFIGKEERIVFYTAIFEGGRHCFLFVFLGGRRREDWPRNYYSSAN